MKPIPIKGYPLERTYDSAEAAIAGARNHPLQPKARADTQRLNGTLLIDGFWTLGDFALRFSNELWLHVFVEEGHVRWALAETSPRLKEDVVEHVGAGPIVLDWGGEIGESPMDRSTLLARRRGAEFTRLWVNEGGLLVYTRGNLILVFHACYRRDTGEDVLFVSEYD